MAIPVCPIASKPPTCCCAAVPIPPVTLERQPLQQPLISASQTTQPCQAPIRACHSNRVPTRPHQFPLVLTRPQHSGSSHSKKSFGVAAVAPPPMVPIPIPPHHPQTVDRVDSIGRRDARDQRSIPSIHLYAHEAAEHGDLKIGPC
jgi:hypothetical protein